jgi:vancomycin resistance protein YoaR
MKKEGNNKKSDKKLNADAKINKKREKKSGILWFLGVSALSVSLLVGCQLFFENTLAGNEKFYENTKINGIDVGGLSVAEAENVVLTNMLEQKKNIEIKLCCGDKSWTLEGADFEVVNKVAPAIKKLSSAERGGNFFQNLSKEKDIRENGRSFQISYSLVLSNLNEKIDEIISQVEQESVEPSLVFSPEMEEPFSISEGQNAIIVNRDKLFQEIDEKLGAGTKAEIEIPIFEIENTVDIEALKNSVTKRAEFSTSYEKSSTVRKNNIKKALECFNGMIVQSGQTVSFNETTGERTEEAGYGSAHIIVGGVYVDGVGGGVCQASTTLYNALLLADIDVLTVNHHSLPASYVPLSLDAMVSGNYCDLVFQNNLSSPIYIKTSCDDKNVKVEIFGQKFDDGTSVGVRSELVKILPHNGDRIVKDEKGEYSNKILYKGEYLRIKYPREGYESKAFVQYFKDGVLESEKEIRHDFYSAQDGIVMEGVEDAAEGMTIPASDVKLIKPQKLSSESGDAVKNRIKNANPSEFNP